MKKGGMEIKALGDVVEIIMGQSPPSDTYNTEGKGMPFFQGKAEFGDRFPIVKKYCSAPKKLAKKGDILMSVRAPVGSVNIANVDCCIGRGLCAIRPSTNAELLYVYHYLRLKEKDIEHRGQGSTFKAINKNEIKKIKIPIPPLSVQKQIVAILERVEKIQERNKRAAQELSDLYAVLIQKAFSGELVS